MPINKTIYLSGIEVMHPGGLKKTEEMALACQINQNSKVLLI